MADPQRFALFARFVVERFTAPVIYDIAGGQGRLNVELVRLGRRVVTFDTRHKHLHVEYAMRRFGLEEPCACDLLVGMHPDGATRVVIAYAAKHRVPFAVVPCCSDNGMSYKPWMRHLRELAEEGGLVTQEGVLSMRGRARVLMGEPA